MKNVFARNNNKFFYWIVCPIFAVFILNFILFAVASFYDYQIMEMFEKGMKIKFVRYLAVFYVNTGRSEIFIAFIICIFIMFQYLFKYLNEKKGLDNRLWTWVAYGLCIVAQILIASLTVYNTITIKKGIPGTDLYSLNTLFTKSEFTGMSIFIVVYQVLILVAILTYIQLVFVKKKDFFLKKHWISAIKVFVICALIYIFVVVLKISMGRKYFHGLEEVIRRRIEYSGYKDVIVWNPKWVINAGYEPWWVPDGLFNNPEGFNWNFRKIFEQFAFPSGHMAATTTVGMCFIFIINPSNKDLSAKKITGFYFFIIHFCMMQITFLINGSHWLTDTAFTIMLSILGIYFGNLIVDKIVEKSINKAKNKKIKVENCN